MLEAIDSQAYDNIFNLTLVQRELYNKLLDFDIDSEGNVSRKEPLLTWKVIVCDQLGSDIITQVLTAHDLQRLGVVTLLDINDDRAPLPNIPIVYLVSPTPANLAKIKEDHALYTHILLWSVYDYDFREYFDANPGIVECQVVKSAFLATSSKSFTALSGNAFRNLTLGLGTKEQMDKVICDAEVALKQMADFLKLRYVALYEGEQFSPAYQLVKSVCGYGVPTASRALCIVFNRSADIHAPFQIPQTYEGALMEMFDKKNQKVQYHDQTIILNLLQDKFWYENHCQNFQQVINNINTTVQALPQSNLTSAAGQMQAYTKTKREADTHMNLITDWSTWIQTWTSLQPMFEPLTSSDRLYEAENCFKDDVPCHQVIRARLFAATNPCNSREVRQTVASSLQPDIDSNLYEILVSAIPPEEPKAPNGNFNLFVAKSKQLYAQIKPSEVIGTVEREVSSFLSGNTQHSLKNINDYSDLRFSDISSVVIFIVGGGTLDEQLAVTNMSTRFPKKVFFYGCSEFLTAKNCL